MKTKCYQWNIGMNQYFWGNDNGKIHGFQGQSTKLAEDSIEFHHATLSADDLTALDNFCYHQRNWPIFFFIIYTFKF